jgi:hypothetical protein
MRQKFMLWLVQHGTCWTHLLFCLQEW